MVRRNALIRKLPAVETLGCVTSICSDKTGTLTQNKMTVQTVCLSGSKVTVTGDGYNPVGELLSEGRPVTLADDAQLELMLTGLVLCNDAHLTKPDEGSRTWGIVGDPTEGALVVLGAKAGVNKRAIEHELVRVAEIPFDSDRKRMTTFHRRPDDFVSFTKGAVDGIVGLCDRRLANGTASELTVEDRASILCLNDELAGGGQRVLAIACREWQRLPGNPTVAEAENGLTYIGLVGMIDPPRQEATAAVATCLEAGIQPIMITGDHRLTAEAIARSIGILRDGGRSLAGTDVDRMDDEHLRREVGSVSVYSRVSPLHKMRVVEALQAEGQIVAMTGDGVNDAPALKRADIGVAMGISGTDVSKEASDMVLTDDNFATIVAAVAEGRAIYDNIRKFIRYMLTTNSAEVLTMFGAVLVGLPLPLLPIQILWINLVTDGLPALALGFEPAERGVMHRPPRHPRESIFAHGMWQNIVALGIMMAVFTLALMAWALNSGYDIDTTRTLVFFTLAAFQMFTVMALRSERESLFSMGILSNPQLAGAVALTFALQFAVTYVPFLQSIFHTVPLGLDLLVLSVVVSSTAFFVTEFVKLIVRRREERAESSTLIERSS